MVDKGFEGYCDPIGCAPGWAVTVDWLGDFGGYVEGELGTSDPQTGKTLFVGEMKHQTTPPSGWPACCLGTWDDFTDLVEDYGGSTAGFAPMQESVDHVVAQINEVLSDTGASRIDIAAHSQGGAVARKAVRQLASDGNNEVARLITLGTPHYGASTSSVIFDRTIWASWNGIAEYFLERCRESNWIPFCRDVFLEPPASRNVPIDNVPVGVDANEVPFLDTSGRPTHFDPYECVTSVAPWSPTVPPFCATRVPFRFETGTTFYANLNAPTGGAGPVPSGTQFYNLYTRDHDGGGQVANERYVLEQMKLFPTRSNVRNWNYQSVIMCGWAIPNYGIQHINEWDDPFAQSLLAAALGFTPEFPVPSGCLPGPGAG